MVSKEELESQIQKVQQELDLLSKMLSTPSVSTTQKHQVPLPTPSAVQLSTPSQPQPTVLIDPKDLPGEEGTFDGYYINTDSGEKYEVPSNYAAKSKLVYGDILKRIDEGGKKVFKQIHKVPRRKILGVLSNQGDKWSLLTDGGSYEISSNAAIFNKAEPHDEASALIPDTEDHVPFATLDKVMKFTDTIQDVSFQQPTHHTHTTDIGSPPIQSTKPPVSAGDNKTLGDDDLR